ncbi:glutaredoxin [Antricoccus suffuscus]|uniref:Glutaredoxin n=1 Tax=Antricoccus suffuscus TaxID=1629062 RepID=A0A2T0ZRT8_9ACTN|nr:glutaredoxin family protein [Antricoccus suffuscus]PRZ39072.1 glutaredoxin [Antricoccus suffuscus]
MRPTVELMVRADCHLCAVAREVLERVLPSYGLTASYVDIDRDPELRAEYGDRVPVTLINGKEHGYFDVDEKRLRASLDALT